MAKNIKKEYKQILLIIQKSNNFFIFIPNGIKINKDYKNYKIIVAYIRATTKGGKANEYL